jgi:hypothetical protein
MTISQLIKWYINLDEHEPRKIGRYYASETYSIIKGYLKPQDFFTKRDVDDNGSKLISEGIATEDFLTKVFSKAKEKGVIDVSFQDKHELKISDDITLVVKPDYNFSLSFLSELKRPREISYDIPEKWQYQLECEYRAFNKPVQLWQVYYPMSFYHLDYTPSNERWEEIKRALISFHNKLNVSKKQ